MFSLRARRGTSGRETHDKLRRRRGFEVWDHQRDRRPGFRRRPLWIGPARGEWLPKPWRLSPAVRLQWELSNCKGKAEKTALWLQKRASKRSPGHQREEKNRAEGGKRSVVCETNLQPWHLVCKEQMLNLLFFLFFFSTFFLFFCPPKSNAVTFCLKSRLFHNGTLLLPSRDRRLRIMQSVRQVITS